MKDSELGKLEKVDLRQIWQTEGQDFTPWLVREENLEMLGSDWNGVGIGSSRKRCGSV